MEPLLFSRYSIREQLHARASTSRLATFEKESGTGMKVQIVARAWNTFFFIHSCWTTIISMNIS